MEEQNKTDLRLHVANEQNNIRKRMLELNTTFSEIKKEYNEKKKALLRRQTELNNAWDSGAIQPNLL